MTQHLFGATDVLSPFDQSSMGAAVQLPHQRDNLFQEILSYFYKRPKSKLELALSTSIKNLIRHGRVPAPLLFDFLDLN
jgi:hypothetical protein